MSVRLIIADDEPPLRAWLRRLLAEVAPDAEVIAEAADGDTALREIERLNPHAALLDIRMPGLSGLEVAARIRHPCRVVFITAYDEFAVQAFEQAAVDYLLKPVSAKRLAKTMARLTEAPPSNQGDLVQRLIERLEQRPAPLRWLRVGDGDAVRLIDVDEVDRFEAADKYTLVFAGERQWLMRIALKELERQLDSEAFWRVHRGTLVRVAAIRQVRRDLMGRLWLDLHAGGAPVAVSRSHAERFRQM